MDSSSQEISPVIKRPLPNAVIYDLSYADRVVITLPTGSTWSSGLHWHEQHAEYLRVVKGKVRVRLGDKVQVICAPESGNVVREIKVEKNTRHEWSREAADGEDVAVVERTEPEDGNKAIFFWNLNGVVLDAQAESKLQETIIAGFSVVWLEHLLREFQVHLKLFTISRSLDNFPVFVDLTGSSAGGYLKKIRPALPSLVEWLIAHFLLEAAAIFSSVWGIEPVQRKYTPKDAFDDWQRMIAGESKHE
ncbi:hypothetical protein BFW01_g11332 [Lasiodiplodia theobromae]|nr:hypothetical protein BFW01_g11332 [Lasiodiplodia theobromae]